MKPVLYGLGFSLYVRKVRFILEFKGIDYDFDSVPPSQAEDYLKISPLGKIPAMTFDDFNISDSSVIALYLEKKYPQEAILPENPEDYAKALWYDEYSDTRMTEIISGIFFEKFGRPRFFGDPPNEERIAELETRFPEIFDYLEGQLEGKTYLVGSSLSLADFSVISNLYNHKMCGYEIDSDRWPNTAAYQSFILNEPSVKAVIEQEVSEGELD